MIIWKWTSPVIIEEMLSLGLMGSNFRRELIYTKRNCNHSKGNERKKKLLEAELYFFFLTLCWVKF
jgi:hypothetical protein